MTMVTPSGEQWSSRFAFILAAVGAAVGLGNVWKFPYTTGSSGGSAFVLVYLLAVMLVALPILIVELTIGRKGRCSPPESVALVAERNGRSRRWGWIGWLGPLAAFLVLSFYSVIGGWVMAYVPKSMSGAFAAADADAVGAVFGSMLSQPLTMLLWHTVFMALTVIIVSAGVRKGLERVVDMLMPALVLMLFVLVGYALYAGDAASAFTFMFSADFSAITPEVVLAAIGQALFSTAVGAGAMMAYGAYLPQSVSIPRVSLIVVLADTFVALMAGLIVFPLVFANGLDPAEGPGLVFVSLPLAFGHMPAGSFFASFFFVLLFFAAITSSISMLEPIVAWARERFAMQRKMSALIAGGLAWGIGLLTILSFNVWSDVHPLDRFATFSGKTIFDLLDYFVSNMLLPLSAMLLALFAGWMMSGASVREELGLRDGPVFRLWQWSARVVAPLAVALVFVTNLA
ncbi:MAG: sodium-dependent transporter [Chromatiales bacterium]|nr:sodium-dependent transporter [Chromatiales bacterium]MDH3894251.1 sodium-dependent transporter [Chromatiales bacterium]MDH3932929.1 sodium-dependent transporter [Chromatiales bacterium]MDH4012407.1 sodium-dependent transporter [Chromatiales bacterium]